KVAGVVFLGTARTGHGTHAIEGGAATQTPTLLLAAACAALGVVPTVGISLVRAAAHDLSGMGGAVMPAAVVSGAWALTWLAAATGVLAALVWVGRSVLTRHQVVRREVTWRCGYDAATPRMPYTA